MPRRTCSAADVLDGDSVQRAGCAGRAGHVPTADEDPSDCSASRSEDSASVNREPPGHGLRALAGSASTCRISTKGSDGSSDGDDEVAIRRGGRHTDANAEADSIDVMPMQPNGGRGTRAMARHSRLGMVRSARRRRTLALSSAPTVRPVEPCNARDAVASDTPAQRATSASVTCSDTVDLLAASCRCDRRAEPIAADGGTTPANDPRERPPRTTPANGHGRAVDRSGPRPAARSIGWLLVLVLALDTSTPSSPPASCDCCAPTSSPQLFSVIPRAPRSPRHCWPRNR